MVSTGWLQWPNWMVDYTFGLVPHNLFYARRKAIFMPVIDIKAFFQSCVFPICWAYCLSCPIVLAGGFPRKGEQSSTPWRKISFFCIPYRLHIKSLCGYITGAGIYCSSRLAIFCTCRKKVGMGNGEWNNLVLLSSYPDAAGERATSENSVIHSGPTALQSPYNLPVHYSCSLGRVLLIVD